MIMIIMTSDLYPAISVGFFIFLFSTLDLFIPRRWLLKLVVEFISVLQRWSSFKTTRLHFCQMISSPFSNIVIAIDRCQIIQQLVFRLFIIELCCGRNVENNTPFLETVLSVCCARTRMHTYIRTCIQTAR